MVSPTQVVNGSSSGSSDVKEIMLDYDLKTYGVSVDPDTVNRGDTICFKTHEGMVRVVFVSPFNDNTVEMLDSEERKLTVSGAYPFLCFFTEDGEGESEARTGGILDVQPHRP
jgi:hypothetical protein